MSVFTRSHPPQRPQGTMTHVSTRPVMLPPVGVDSQVDRAVLAGQYRDVELVTLTGGKQIRVGRTKGVTYWRHPRTPGMKRADHRAAA